MEREPGNAMPLTPAENRAYRQMLLLIALILLSVGAVYLFLDGPARCLRSGSIDRLPPVMDFYKRAPLPGRQRVLVYGDSIGMSGFDGYTFDELGHAQGIDSYNLARSAASLSELLFDLSEPGLAEDECVIFVSPLTLSGARHSRIHPQKSDLYNIYGAGPDPGLFARFAQHVPQSDMSYTLEPRWKHVLASRWRFETALRYPIQSLRIFTRDDRAQGRVLTHFCTDLKYPNWNGHVDARELEREIQYDLGQMGDHFHLEPGSADTLGFMVEEFSARCRKLTILVPPINPRTSLRMPPGYMEDFRRELRALSADKARIIDLSSYLSADEFRDGHHYTPAGGTRLTREFYRLYEAGS